MGDRVYEGTDRDIFPFNCGKGGREFVAGLSRHKLTATGGNRGCWSGCLGRSAAENQTDRRASTASTIGPGIGIGIAAYGVNVATARQPELAGRLFTNFIIGAALAEALALIGFVLAFIM